ncbi:MAG: OmpA family protein [Saprospiraceae bacterium]
MKLLPIFLLLLVATGCVRQKIYQAELIARQKCEARESVLVKEVLSRREESGNFTQRISDLSRTIGMKDQELESLKTELTKRTVQMGESSSKLAQEKAATENELAARTAQLNNANAQIQSVREAQAKRAAALNDLLQATSQKMHLFQDVSCQIDRERIRITLPDGGLFEADGLSVSAAGKNLLRAVAELLASRPDVDVQVEAHTDNALPKDKTIKDTWDWSLARAVTLTRIMISDYNVNANQLSPVAKGEFFPLTSNETPEGRKKNRRTVLTLTQKLAPVPGL